MSCTPEHRTCDSCGEPLALDVEGDPSHGYDNALVISFDGGYGMFVESAAFLLMDQFWKKKFGPDSIPEMPLPLELHLEFNRYVDEHHPHKAWICHRCAHELCEKIPWIAALLQPHSSHAHHYAEVPNLVAQGHQGWDLDKEYEKLAGHGDEAKE